MWSLLIKVASLGKGALVVSVAASAVMVSNAELSTAPSHHDTPPAFATPEAKTPKTEFAVTAPVSKPSTTEPKTDKTDKTERTEPKPDKTEKTEPKTEQGTHDEIHGVVKECIEKYLALRAQGDAASRGDRQSVEAVCKAALEQTGLTSAQFWAKFGPHTDPHAGSTTPTAPKTESPTTSRTLENWIKECVTKYTLKAPDASEFCRKAIELSGLTSSEFAAKYLHQTTTGGTTIPVTTPKPVPSTTEFSQLVAKCVQLYTAVVQKTSTDTHAASEACGAATRASGLTSTQFWAKYFPTKS